MVRMMDIIIGIFDEAEYLEHNAKQVVSERERTGKEEDPCSSC